MTTHEKGDRERKKERKTVRSLVMAILRGSCTFRYIIKQLQRTFLQIIIIYCCSFALMWALILAIKNEWAAAGAADLSLTISGGANCDAKLMRGSGQEPLEQQQVLCCSVHPRAAVSWLRLRNLQTPTTVRCAQHNAKETVRCGFSWGA